MRERSVAVEMVLCDVEKNADRGVERRREVDLIRGALDDVSARLIWRGQREDGGADVTADLGVAASRARRNSSISPITSTPAARASLTVQ